jgi:recombination protein RecR
MAELSESVTHMIEQFSRLPGIGRKSAERLAYHILRVPESEAFALSDSIRNVRENVRYCDICFNLAESEMCNICRDPARDQTHLCVVEQPRDLMALEQAGTYRGLYHVLLGRIAPLENVGPDQLTIDQLVGRIAQNASPDLKNENGAAPPQPVGVSRFTEVIMATNPTVEGDGTALHISNLLAEYDVTLTRLARGITTGSILEYTNKEILADAMAARQPL